MSIFKISPQKTKMPKFRTKNALFGYFWAGILKNYCYIWNQHRQIFLIAKFHGKTKMSKFGTKMAYLEIFDQKRLIWKFLARILNIILSYLKSALSNLSHCKILRKKQKCLIWVFLSWNFKKLLSYLKSASSNFPNCKISRKNKNA